MSSLKSFTFRLHDSIVFGIMAGNLGLTKYVILLFTSELHVVSTV